MKKTLFVLAGALIVLILLIPAIIKQPDDLVNAAARSGNPASAANANPSDVQDSMSFL